MGDIVSLTAVRQERTPHLHGAARCVGFRHEWQAVAPVGTVHLDCPACLLPKGLFVNLVSRGQQARTCNCGNDLFQIAPGLGPYCTGCGAQQLGWF